MSALKKVAKKVTKKDPTCKDCEGTGLYGPNLAKNEKVICSACVGSGKV